jgi:FMN reductase
MARQLLIVGLGGSVAAPSRSLAALELALESVQQAGAQTILFDLHRLELPIYDPTVSVPGKAEQELIETAYRADGLLWSSPLYHGTISGALKNALDWLHLLDDRDPPYLTDKVIGLISTAGGTQGLQAANTMEFVVRALRAWAVPYVVPVAQAWRVFDEGGRILDETVAGQLRLLGSEVTRVAGLFALADLDDPEAECARASQTVAAAAEASVG